MAEGLLASEEGFWSMELARYHERSKHMRMTELVISQLPLRVFLLWTKFAAQNCAMVSADLQQPVCLHRQQNL